MIDYQNELLKYKKKEDVFSFRFDDIDLIEQYKTPALAEKRIIFWLPWDSYNYSKIVLNNGKEIYITCFLVNELELPIDQNKIKTNKRLFPIIES